MEGYEKQLVPWTTDIENLFSRKDNKVEIKRTFCFLFSSELPASSPLVRLPFLFLDPEQKYVTYQATIVPKTIALPDKNCPFIQSLLYESQYKP